MVNLRSKYLQKNLGLLLEHLVALKQIKESKCGKISAQYDNLEADVLTAKIDLDIFPSTRLDNFFIKTMCIHKKYPELSDAVALILTLSHGNADVERGFSLNKGVQKVNVSEDSIVGKTR